MMGFRFLIVHMSYFHNVLLVFVVVDDVVVVDVVNIVFSAS